MPSDVLQANIVMWKEVLGNSQEEKGKQIIQPFLDRWQKELNRRKNA
ncbi:MAG: hypothetical protein H8D45_20840 [Bacteroidetes bacterium]|nr:hypothetical protein [Bacteroidota bacterium]